MRLLGWRLYGAGMDPRLEEGAAGFVGSNTVSVCEVKRSANSSGHPHAQSSLSVSSPCVSSGASGGGFPSVGFRGFTWLGTGSVVCTACRLRCVVRGVACMVTGHCALCATLVECTIRVGTIQTRICVWCADLNSGEERSRCGQVQGYGVGCPFLDNASGDAGLADCLRWAPKKLAD